MSTTQESCLIFQNNFLKAQEPPNMQKVTQAAWMKKEYLAELTWEKEAWSRWKQEQAMQKEYRDIAWAYRKMLKQLELKLPRDIRKRASMSTLAAKVTIENRDP